MQKILITGAGGFVGSHLVSRLKKLKNTRLKTLDREKHSLEDKKSLLGLVDGCDLIFHLAAINNPISSELFKINTLGTANILEAIKEKAPRSRLVFPSTFAVYRTPNKGEKVTENFELAPRNRYGLSKLLTEEIVRYYSNIEGIKSVILRLSNVYGPGIEPFRHSVVATFFDLIKKGKPLTINGDGRQTRDFVYIDDIVDALVASAGLKSNFEVVNACSGEEISIKALVGAVGEVIGKRVRVTYQKADLSGGGFWRGDNAKAKKVLGWKPKTDFKLGLKKTWEKTQ